MTRSRSWIGNSNLLSVALAAALVQDSRTKRRRVARSPTPEQIAKREKVSEREQWNAEVEQRKAQKRAARGK